MAVGVRTDPFGAFRFKVEINGLIAGGFSEISGLQAETEVDEYHAGGLNEFIYKLPKNTRYPNLVLKRGLGDSELFDWYQKIIKGEIIRYNCFIWLEEPSGKSWQWNFNQAYPVKWVGPDLKADSNAVAFEALELVHCGFSKTK